MGIWGRGAIRAGCLFVAACVVEWFAGWQWAFDYSTAGLWLVLLGIVPAAWAYDDASRLGSDAAQWIWAQVAAWVAAGTLIVTVLAGSPVVFGVLLGWVTAAAVAVPAWSIIGGTVAGGQAPATGPRRRVPTEILMSVTVGGVGLYLLAPIVALGVLAAVEWSGCFVDCQQPNHLAALGLSAATAVLIADVVMWGVAARRRFPRLLTGVAAIPVCGYAVAAVVMG